MSARMRAQELTGAELEQRIELARAKRTRALAQPRDEQGRFVSCRSRRSRRRATRFCVRTVRHHPLAAALVVGVAWLWLAQVPDEVWSGIGWGLLYALAAVIAVVLAVAVGMLVGTVVRNRRYRRLHGPIEDARQRVAWAQAEGLPASLAASRMLLEMRREQAGLS